MSSYFASLASSTAISNLGTRLNTLRRAITSGDEADDPDNEDCSHISNVLRAYYTEKGRSYPPWLPADPKTPIPQPRMIVTQASLQQGGHGQPAPPGPRSGGLGDLWGDPSAASQPPPPSQTSSLRNRPVATASLRPPVPHSQTPPPPQVSARPLPSQRAGSYQTSSSASSQSRLGLDRTGSGSSAQERLRARLHGGGPGSPSPPPAGQSPAPGRPQQPSMSSSRPWEQGDQAGFDGGFTNNPYQGYGQSAYSGAGSGGGAYNKRPTGMPSPKPRGPR